MNETKNYVEILEKTLELKLEVLEKIKKLGENNNPYDIDDIDGIDMYLNQKEKLLRELEKLDEGFEVTYNLAKKELNESKDEYKDNIKRMQKNIKKITDVTVDLRISETKMKRQFEDFCKRKKDEVKIFRKGNTTAMKYYKNMAGVHKNEQSYFFNSKQ